MCDSKGAEDHSSARVVYIEDGCSRMVAAWDSEPNKGIGCSASYSTKPKSYLHAHLRAYLGRQYSIYCGM